MTETFIGGRLMTPENLTATLAAAIAKMEEQPLPALETGEEAGILLKTACAGDAVYLLITIGPAVKYNRLYSKYSAFLHILVDDKDGIPQNGWVHCSRKENLREILREFEILLDDFRHQPHNSAAYTDAATMAVCVNNPFAKPAHAAEEEIKGVKERSNWFLLSA